MLDIGGFRARDCQSLSRRAFLKVSAAAPWALSLAGGLPAALAAQQAGKAKSVLLVWLWGAPSHLDTFDPKPDAPIEYRGPFSTIATRTPGVRYTELLPKIASRSDRLALIRSNKNFHGGHLEAGNCGLTGFLEGPAGIKPNFGAIVAKHRGYGELPPFVALGRGNPRDVVGVVKGYGGGDWGDSYDPFMMSCSELGQVDVPSLKLLDGLPVSRLGDRQTLLTETDRIRREVESGDIDRWEKFYGRALGLLSSPETQQALDLSREPQRTREAFGQTSFGQSLLLGRRLVEAGVPYVQVNWSQYVEAMTPHTDFGWDTHIFNFEMLPDRHCPIFDQAFSALLDDLRDRGLLDTTLVVAMGEFGRTPKINGQAARDHWPNCYFSIWAGAGVVPGRVIGESDKLGQETVTEPITPLMVGTTMAELAGVGTAERAELRVLDGGRVIHELF